MDIQRISVLIYLDTVKCELTSFQLSQSSPVILYILTCSLMFSANGTVTSVPGEMDSTIGRSSSRRSCNGRINWFWRCTNFNGTCVTNSRMLSYLPVKQLLLLPGYNQYRRYNQPSLQEWYIWNNLFKLKLCQRLRNVNYSQGGSSLPYHIVMRIIKLTKSTDLEIAYQNQHPNPHTVGKEILRRPDQLQYPYLRS